MSALPPTLSQSTYSAATNARQQYNLAYQVSPIVLQDGIAANAQGGLLPIISLYNQTDETDPNAFFATYLVLPGGTLISNAAATYPFANAQVAANALIQQPLTLSMLMICPLNQPGAYLSKLATFSALQASLNQHCAIGGRFAVATPAMVYDDLLLISMVDVTHSETQPQIMYQLDFIKPLLTLSQATAAYNQTVTKFTNGNKIVGQPAWSGNIQANSSTTNGLNAALRSFGGTLQGANGTTSPQGSIGVGS